MNNDVVICAIAKQEYDFLKDWVQWHLRIGFDKIYIYDNNDINGERYEDLLSEYIENNQVELIDVRGKHAAQIDSYNEFYNKYEFEWVLYIDVDEFLYFKPTGKYTNIKDFIKMKDDADVYMFEWELYAASEQDTSKGHVWDLCTKKLPPNARKHTDSNLISWHKSMIRSGKGFKVNEHTIVQCYWEYHVYDERGNRMYSQLEFFDPKRDHNNVNCCINHYILRDIKTFFYNKYLRGHAGIENAAGMDGYISECWLQNLNYYTDLQKTLTFKEQEFLLEKGYRINYTYYPTIIMMVYIMNVSPEYYKGIENAVRKVRNSADCNLKIIVDKNIMYDNNGTNHDYWIDNYNIDRFFNIDKKVEEFMLDSPGVVKCEDFSNNYFIQEPIIINIGVPMNGTERQVQMMVDVINDIFNTNKINEICRDITFYNQKESLIYTPKKLILTSENDDLFGEDNKNYGLELKHKRLYGNVFITNMPTYRNIIKLYKQFEKDGKCAQNNYIIENDKARYATFYNQFNYLWPSSVNKIIEI